MPEKMEILQETSRPALRTMVNAYLKSGWELHGNLIVVFNSCANRMLYVQGVVKG